MNTRLSVLAAALLASPAPVQAAGASAAELNRLYPQLSQRWQKAAGAAFERSRTGLRPAGSDPLHERRELDRQKARLEGRLRLDSFLPSDASRAIVIADGPLRVEHSLVGARPVRVATEGGLGRYEDVLPHVDALVLADGESVQQMLLLRSEKAPTRFVMRFAVRGGALSEEQDGSLSLRAETGGPALRLSRPVALDAEGRTRPGRWSLREAGAGFYTAVLEIDAAGLRYPVLID